MRTNSLHGEARSNPLMVRILARPPLVKEGIESFMHGFECENIAIDSQSVLRFEQDEDA